MELFDHFFIYLIDLSYFINYQIHLDSSKYFTIVYYLNWPIFIINFKAIIAKLIKQYHILLFSYLFLKIL